VLKRLIQENDQGLSETIRGDDCSSENIKCRTEREEENVKL